MIELMIVIAIIGILVAVALPQFASMTEDAKKTKAKQDCDTIAQSIQKYNSLEGAMVEKLMDLKGKYLTNIDTLKDPWGNSYQLDPYGGYVYSKGPDGQDSKIDPKDKKNSDNIRVPYIGALCIVAAKLDVNPTGESDPTLARDVLHLYFNKKVRLAGPISLNTASVGADNLIPEDAVVAGKSADKAAAAGKTFRWCSGSRTRYIEAEDILKGPGPNDEPAEGAQVDDPIDYCVPDFTAPDWVAPVEWAWDGSIPVKYAGDDATAPAVTGGAFHTEDSQEIILVLPAGTTGSIIPGTHYINLTGNRKNTTTTHALFMEFDGTTPAEMSGTPVRVDVFE